MAFQQFTLANLRTFVASRLQNTLFWNALEVQVAINDAIRSWQLATGYWTGRFQVDTIPGQTIYNIGTLAQLQDLNGVTQLTMPLRMAFNGQPIDPVSTDDLDNGYPNPPGWQITTTATSGATTTPTMWAPIGISYFALYPGDAAGNNCFSVDTSIWMADRSWKPIQNIKVGEYVMTMDENGFLISRRVCKTYRKNDVRPWVKVKIRGMVAKRWGSFGVKCTPDHEWYVSNSLKIQARFLRPKEKVLLPAQGNPSLIHGTILGDAHVTDENRLCLAQTNHEWMKAKAENLCINIFGGSNSGGYQNQAIIWEGRVNVSPHWREVFYRKDRTKRWIPPPDDAALAVFYGDDGCHCHREKDRRASTAHFACQSFMREIDDVRNWFWLRFGPCSISNGSIKLRKEASRRFFEAVAPYLHPSMEYKLPSEFWGRYNGWMSAATAQVGEVESVEPCVIKKGKIQSKFCIEVEDTHRFFTRGGLVSNCLQIDGVLRAPTLVLESDFINIDSSQIAAIISEAIAVLSFKRGGVAFQKALAGHAEFVRAAAAINSHIVQAAPFKQYLGLDRSRMSRRRDTGQPIGIGMR